MKKNIIIVLLTMMFLSGCMGSPTKWVKPNLDPQQLEKDDYECEIQMNSIPIEPGNELGSAIYRARMFKRCMQIRGYTLEEY